MTRQQATHPLHLPQSCPLSALRVVLIIAIVIYAIEGVYGLRNVAVNIPVAVTPGDTVTLQCQYDLEGESLYTVKWYKGRKEFFRYIPKELPHSRVFPLSGVLVDVGRSGPHQVVLRDVQLSMGGRYKCEVSADAPSFHTTVVDSYMHVVLLPEGPPQILSDKNRYSVGDTLRVNCSAPAASPPVNLTWYINDKQVSKSFLHRTPAAVITSIEPQVLPYNNLTKIRNPDILINTMFKESNYSPPPPAVTTKTTQRSTAGLDMLLEAHTFQDGQIRVRCVATQFELYRAQADLLLLDEDSPRPALVLATRAASSGCGLQSAVLSLCFLFVLFVSYIGGRESW